MTFTLPQEEYTTLAALKAFLVLTDVDSTVDDATLLSCIWDGSRLIAFECWRQFTPTAAETLRTADAPASPRLYIDDLLDPAGDTPVIRVAGGDPLTVGTDYQFLPYNRTLETPCWTEVRRLVAGVPVNWDAAGGRGDLSPLGVITITGTWGYSTTVPATIEQATLRLAARRWRTYLGQGSSNAGGGSETGSTPVPLALLDPVAAELVRPYVHPRKPPTSWWPR